MHFRLKMHIFFTENERILTSTELADGSLPQTPTVAYVDPMNGSGTIHTAGINGKKWRVEHKSRWGKGRGRGVNETIITYEVTIDTTKLTVVPSWYNM